MSSKINPFDIIVEHIFTLKDARTDKLSIIDIGVFYVIPVIAGLCFFFFTETGYTADASTLWIAALSVLAGLLINVLVLLYTVQTVGPSEQEHQTQRNVIKEVNANLLYAIFIAIVAICALCASPMMPNPPSHLLGVFITFLIGNFLLTLFMAVKRIKILVGMRFTS